MIKKAPHHKESWKCSIKRLLDIQAYISIQHQCKNYPLSDCTLPIGRPAPHWSITLHVTYATCNRNFRTITPLNRMWQAGGGCQPLSIQTTIPSLTTPSVSSATLSLKITFTSLPSALPSHMFDPILSSIPAEVAPHLPDLDPDPVRFMLDLEWIKDAPTQTFTTNFLTQLKTHRNSLLLQLN